MRGEYGSCLCFNIFFHLFLLSSSSSSFFSLPQHHMVQRLRNMLINKSIFTFVFMVFVVSIEDEVSSIDIRICKFIHYSSISGYEKNGTMATRVSSQSFVLVSVYLMDWLANVLPSEFCQPQSPFPSSKINEKKTIE